MRPRQFSVSLFNIDIMYSATSIIKILFTKVPTVTELTDNSLPTYLYSFNMLFVIPTSLASAQGRYAIHGHNPFLVYSVGDAESLRVGSKFSLLSCGGRFLKAFCY